MPQCSSCLATNLDYVFGKNKLPFSTKLCSEQADLGLLSGSETEMGACCVEHQGLGGLVVFDFHRNVQCNLIKLSAG